MLLLPATNSQTVRSEAHVEGKLEGCQERREWVVASRYKASLLRKGVHDIRSGRALVARTQEMQGRRPHAP